MPHRSSGALWFKKIERPPHHPDETTGSERKNGVISVFDLGIMAQRVVEYAGCIGLEAGRR